MFFLLLLLLLLLLLNLPSFLHSTHLKTFIGCSVYLETLEKPFEVHRLVLIFHILLSLK